MQEIPSLEANLRQAEQLLAEAGFAHTAQLMTVLDAARQVADQSSRLFPSASNVAKEGKALAAALDAFDASGIAPGDFRVFGYSITDVRTARCDLSNDQAYQVLQYLRQIQRRNPSVSVDAYFRQALGLFQIGCINALFTDPVGNEVDVFVELSGGHVYVGALRAPYVLPDKGPVETDTLFSHAPLEQRTDCNLSTGKIRFPHGLEVALEGVDVVYAGDRRKLAALVDDLSNYEKTHNVQVLRNVAPC